MEEPLVSVIVPIYNVEPWVRKCLDSLKRQTLKQIEVICVDDGSTDESGIIAEEYASHSDCEWPQFRVIHTENKGLSAARNLGIEEARSGWIMFADSDDWVAEDFCRIPYETAIENWADMVIFLAFDITSKGNLKRSFRRIKMPTRHVDSFTAIQYGYDAAWNRIYKKGLFEKIRYPEGMVHEEVITTHKLVHKAEKIIMTNIRLYYYVDRKGSISNTYTLSNRLDGLRAAIEKYNDLLSYGYPEGMIKDSRCSAAIGYLSCTRDESENLYTIAREIANSTSIRQKGLTGKQRMALLAWKTDERLFYLLSLVFGRLER